MNIRMYPKSPAPRHIAILKETLDNNGLIIIPTDSVYALVCSSEKPEAIKKMALLKGCDPSHFSLLFSDLAMVSDYSKPINKDHYKLMNRVLPGPFTFILQANGNLQKIFDGRKSLGARIPSNNIPLILIKELGAPLICTSIHDDDALIDYTTDPELIIRNWEGKVDVIVNGGYGNNEPSTILDCTDGGITMIRQGIGELDELMV